MDYEIGSTSRKTPVVVVFLFFILNLNGCTTYKPGSVAKTLNSQSIGTIWFTSSDGYDLVSYVKSMPVTVEGLLSIPDNHNGRAVILSHGSGGIGNLHKKWKDFLTRNGYAVFMLDHFRPRNTINVLHSQVRVTEQQMAFDILKASSLLQSHPLIDKNRVYHIGWSKGASAGIIAALDDVKKMVLQGENSSKIAGFIEFYPWCGFRAELKTSSPVLILHGTDDNYTPISFCETLVQDMKKTGSRIKIERFNGAMHGFDNWKQEKKTTNSLTVRKSTDDCTLRVNPETLNIRSLNGKFSVDTYENRKMFLTKCAERGVSIGGSPEYKNRVQTVVLDFLK